MTIKDYVYVGMVIITIILSLISTIKSAKSKKLCISNSESNSAETANNDAVEVSENNFNTVLEIIKSTVEKVTGYMISAETIFSNMGDKTGSLKLQEVLKDLKVDCLSDGVEFSEDSWKTIVECIISATKSINK